MLKNDGILYITAEMVLYEGKITHAVPGWASSPMGHVSMDTTNILFYDFLSTMFSETK